MEYLKIATPSVAEVEKYLKIWHEAPEYEKYRRQEDSVVTLFKELYPKNTEIKEVLIKVGVLNDFYGTKIFDVYPVAQHIVELKIDSNFDNADLDIVDKISRAKGVKNRHYSFATKYCSHHRPDAFPIYDRFVDKMLRYFRDNDKFHEFKNEDLRNYISFKGVYQVFIKHYKLDKFRLREIDWYLWILGKENFPSLPKKRKLMKMNNK